MRTPALPSTFRGRVLVVALLALVVRLVYLYLARNNVGLTPGAPIGGDGVDYHFQSIDLVDGLGFISRPTMREYAGHPPLWVIVLAPGALLTGGSWLAHQLTSVLVGTLVVVAMGYLGREDLGGDRCGLVTAVVAAVYPGLWVYERLLLAEPLMFLWVAVLFVLVYRLRLGEVTWRRVVAVGVVAGLAALTRSETVLLIPLIVLPAILANRQVAFARRWRAALVAGGVAAAVIAPWSIYNLTRFSTPVPLSYGMGITMAISACDDTFRGPNLGFFDVDCLKTMPLGDDDAALDRARARHAVDYQLDHLDRLPRVVLAREGRTWGLLHVGHFLDWESRGYGTPRAVSELRLVAYWMLVPFAAIGAWWRFRRRLWLYPLLVPVGMVVVITAITYGESRYRAVAEISLVALAGFALTQVVGRLRPDQADAGDVDREEDRAEDEVEVGAGAPSSAGDDGTPTGSGTRVQPTAAGTPAATEGRTEFAS